MDCSNLTEYKPPKVDWNKRRSWLASAIQASETSREALPPHHHIGGGGLNRRIPPEVQTVGFWSDASSFTGAGGGLYGRVPVTALSDWTMAQDGPHLMLTAGAENDTS